MSGVWRVGSKVPINVYDGDRPVCQCQTAADAALIVKAVNRQIKRELEYPAPEYSDSMSGVACEVEGSDQRL